MCLSSASHGLLMTDLSIGVLISAYEDTGTPGGLSQEHTAHE